jgi:hypothetical protein
MRLLALAMSQIHRLFSVSLSVPKHGWVLAGFRTYWPDLKIAVAGFENRTRLPTVTTHKLG